MAKHKLDLTKLLEALDRRDFSFYSKLTDEEKKGFTGIVALRYMSSVPDNGSDLSEYFIGTANEANLHFWNSEMTKHPELQYMLLAMCGLGTKQWHPWIKGPAKKKKSKILTILKKYYPTANDEELEFFLSINSKDELLEIAQMLGYQDDEMKDIKKQIKEIKK